MDADQAAALGADMGVLSRVAPNGQCPFCGENGWHTTDNGRAEHRADDSNGARTGVLRSDSHLRHMRIRPPFTQQKPLESARS